MLPVNYYLILSAVVFAIGVIGVLIRRNLIVVLMSIELMLNAVNLTFIAFSRYLGSMVGQVAVFFVMAVAAAEAVIGLAIIISVYRQRRSLDLLLVRRWVEVVERFDVLGFRFIAISSFSSLNRRFTA